MSDIDQLIASFSASASISQEAVDLAALQAQLTSSLKHSNMFACPTTPTMSTHELSPSPASSASYSPAMGYSQARPGSSREGQRMRRPSEIDEEDMQAVEDSLFGVPAHPRRSMDALGLQNAQYPSDASSMSSYAAVDPFFAAQLQQVAAPTNFFTPPSFSFVPQYTQSNRWPATTY